MNESLASLVSWSKRRWIVAAVTSLVTSLVIAIPTAVFSNPVFGREIEPTPWSLPVVIVTSIFSGLLFATYISNDPSLNEEKSIKIGGAGAFFFFSSGGMSCVQQNCSSGSGFIGSNPVLCTGSAVSGRFWDSFTRLCAAKAIGK